MTRLFLPALLAGGSFTLAAWNELTGPLAIAWKGAGVALLALWAWRQARTRDGAVIAAVLACGALGDVLLDGAGLVPGAAAFLAGHLLATWLYLRHTSRRGRWGALASAAGVMLAALAIVPAATIALYAAGLGAMAGAATASMLPGRVALGAWLFVASDLLIFARLGFGWSTTARLLVWPLYFAGQALIAHGTVTALAISPAAFSPDPRQGGAN